MEKPATQVLGNSREHHFVPESARQVILVVGGSLLVALCAHITVPLPFTPVPLTLQNFAVLLVGLLLGSRRGFAALALYLAEGATGLPVFSPIGPGGIAHLFGPTGGFLLAYPLVAWVSGYVMEHGRKTFGRTVIAGLLGEIVLFTGGLAWLAILTHSVVQAFRWGLYWFLFAEIIKIMMAAAMASRWQRSPVDSTKAQ
ncbi:MAG: biotin transporter BioY [Candidatus Sulfotelmatobacter sp.]|jgi:biotin transport system substrate-specific component